MFLILKNWQILSNLAGASFPQQSSSQSSNDPVGQRWPSCERHRGRSYRDYNGSWEKTDNSWDICIRRGELEQS